MSEGKEKYDAACALVDAMAGETEAAKGYGTELNYHIVVDGIIVEIHRLTSLFYYRRELSAVYKSYSDMGMAVGGTSIMINGVQVWLPADTFNALFSLPFSSSSSSSRSYVFDFCDIVTFYNFY